MTEEFRMLVKANQLFDKLGSVKCEWSVEHYIKQTLSSTLDGLINQSKSDAESSAVFSSTVFGKILKSTDYDCDVYDSSKLTGPFALAFSHEIPLEEDEDEDSLDVTDSIVFFDTLDEAIKAYNDELKKESLYIASVVFDIKYSNVYKNGVEVSKSILMQQERAPRSLKQGISSPSNGRNIDHSHSF